MSQRSRDPLSAEHVVLFGQLDVSVQAVETVADLGGQLVGNGHEYSTGVAGRAWFTIAEPACSAALRIEGSQAHRWRGFTTARVAESGTWSSVQATMSVVEVSLPPDAVVGLVE